MTRAVTRSIAVMGAAAVLLSGSATILASHAGAATKPPWEVAGAKDVNEVGTLALYNASGTQVTTGSVTAPGFAKYIVGSTADSVHNVATAFLATPKDGIDAGLWAGEGISLSTNYPVTGAGVPAVVSGATGPVVTEAASDESIATYIGDFPNTDTSTAGYVNAYQLRVKTSTNGTYQSLDFTVSNLTKDGSGNVTGGTWTETYPGLAPTATSTTLAVSATSATLGHSVTLTATESSGSTHPAGSVQFFNNGKKLGSAVTVSAGVAKLKTKALPVGKDAITASFTPSDSSFAGSVSTAKTVKVSELALKNTKKPALSGRHKVGKPEKVSTGKWSPKPSKLTYQWFLGAKKIKHATKSSFKPTSADANKKISCTVTAKKSGFITAKAKSKSVKIKK